MISASCCKQATYDSHKYVPLLTNSNCEYFWKSPGDFFFVLFVCHSCQQTALLFWQPTWKSVADWHCAVWLSMTHLSHSENSSADPGLHFSCRFSVAFHIAFSMQLRSPYWTSSWRIRSADGTSELAVTALNSHSSSLFRYANESQSRISNFRRILTNSIANGYRYVDIFAESALWQQHPSCLV